MSARRERMIGQKAQCGQAAVEFALTVSILMLLLVGMLEMTLFIYTYAVLADSAKEGVRYAIVHGGSGTNPTGPGSGTAWTTPWPACSSGNSSTAAPVVTVVQRYANMSLHGTSTMNINVCYPDGDNKAGSAVEVSVSYLYQPLFGLGWPSVTVYANSAGRIVF
jgi:Flp pilus assembly protein TadG